MIEIKKRKNERKYSRIRAEADDIIQQRKRISCLSVREAEQGRIEGGRRNVEASCLIGRKDKTNAQDTGAIKNSQELKLEEWASYEKIWFDNAGIKENWKRIDDGTSVEAEVYDFGVNVRKVFHYKVFSDYPMDFINDRISIHNGLFPDTKYELIGFTKTEKGFAFVLEQPYIDGADCATEEEIEEFMKVIGFPNREDKEYWNDYYTVKDIHPGNVLKVKDRDGSFKMFVIDPIPSLGGKSEYLPFRVI